MKLYVGTKSTPPFGRPGARPSFRFTATQKSNVYDAIVESGDVGLTRAEIAVKVNLAPHRISFYLSDLRRSGYIAVKGDPTTVNANMSAEEAAFASLLGLENALVARVREKGTTTEMDRGYVRYTKVKELALRPGTGPEGVAALRQAIIELVKLIF